MKLLVIVQCTKDKVAAVVCEPESRSACGKVGLSSLSWSYNPSTRSRNDTSTILISKSFNKIPDVNICHCREQPPSWDPATKFTRLQIPLLGHTSSAASIVYWQFYLLQNCSYLVLYCVHLCHVYFAGWRLGQVLLKLPPHWRTSWCVKFFLNANIFCLSEKYSFCPGEPAVGGWRPSSVFILDRRSSE